VLTYHATRSDPFPFQSNARPPRENAKCVLTAGGLVLRCPDPPGCGSAPTAETAKYPYAGTEPATVWQGERQTFSPHLVTFRYNLIATSGMVRDLPRDACYLPGLPSTPPRQSRRGTSETETITMALKPVRGSDRVTLLGWTEPRPYEAGSMNGRPFPAGRSMKVCVGTDDHGFTILKVKNADVANVHGALSDLGRGVLVDIEYTPQQNEAPHLHLVARAQSTAGASTVKAA
jgi:hypothetical protein